MTFILRSANAAYQNRLGIARRAVQKIATGGAEHQRADCRHYRSLVSAMKLPIHAIWEDIKFILPKMELERLKTGDGPTQRPRAVGLTGAEGGLSRSSPALVFEAAAAIEARTITSNCGQLVFERASSTGTDSSHALQDLRLSWALQSEPVGLPSPICPPCLHTQHTPKGRHHPRTPCQRWSMLEQGMATRNNDRAARTLPTPLRPRFHLLYRTLAFRKGRPMAHGMRRRGRHRGHGPSGP